MPAIERQGQHLYRKGFLVFVNIAHTRFPAQRCTSSGAPSVTET
jgi:hypothetical protein